VRVEVRREGILERRRAREQRDAGRLERVAHHPGVARVDRDDHSPVAARDELGVDGGAERERDHELRDVRLAGLRRIVDEHAWVAAVADPVHKTSSFAVESMTANRKSKAWPEFKRRRLRRRHDARSTNFSENGTADSLAAHVLFRAEPNVLDEFPALRAAAVGTTTRRAKKPADGPAANGGSATPIDSPA